MPNVVIIGAGPAGIAAASILVDHGVAATLIDEGRRAGGQAYREPPDCLELDIDALLGSESRKYRRIDALFETIRDRMDYRPETLAWNIFEEEIYTLAGAIRPTSNAGGRGWRRLSVPPGRRAMARPIHASRRRPWRALRKHSVRRSSRV